MPATEPRRRGVGLATAVAALGGAWACGGPATHPRPAGPADRAHSGAADPPRTRPTVRPPLGLEAGAAWKFQGSATGWDDAAGTDVEHLIAITTTVEAADVVDGRPRWRLHGWPTDAVEHEPGDPEVDTWLLLDGGVMYLATRPAGAPGPRRGEPDDAWLRWPPRDGDEVCPDPDSPYCWRVEAGADDHTYRVIMQTRPDVLAYEIDPARGVLGIEYHHNGTTDDVSLGRVP